MIADLARAWIGTPYVHQASLRGGGTDCLGLLRGIWREIYGAEPVQIPPYSMDWSEAGGREDLRDAADKWLIAKDLADADAGDVVLFRMRIGAVAKHLGIQGRVQNPSFIHAYYGHAVVESALTQAWQRKIVARYRFP
jgi:NlpC/P60 family putative phage cell wall peptidase